MFSLKYLGNPMLIDHFWPVQSKTSETNKKWKLDHFKIKAIVYRESHCCYSMLWKTYRTTFNDTLSCCSFCSVPDHFQSLNVRWHTSQRSPDSAQSSDRPAMVRGCWRINTRSRKRGLRIRSHSISEGSVQPISLLPGTISTTTLQALYNCSFLGYKQAVFITPLYSLVLSSEINIIL